MTRESLLMGDLLLTLFVPIWMFWSFGCVYFCLENMLFYIPAAIYSIIFLEKVNFNYFDSYFLV